MKKLLLTTLSLFTVSAHAWEPSFYAGANYGSEQTKFSTPPVADYPAFPFNYTVKALEGQAGIILTPYISLEARVGAGLGESTESWQDIEEEDDGTITINSSAEGTYKTNYYASVYFRPYIANEKASLYGLLGYSTIDYDYSVLTTVGGAVDADADLSDTDSGLSFGVGVSFVMSPNVDLIAEWKKTINADDFDMRGGHVGFIYKF